MVEAEWWEYDDAAEMVEAVAGDAQFLIESALDARGDAVAALPGSTSVAGILDKLKSARLKWKDVTIVPTDDLLVPVDSPLSRVRVLAERFLPLGARVLPLTGGNLAVGDAGRAADARLQAIHWPPDVVWLDVNEHGHAAGIAPGPDFDAAITAPHRAIGLMPEPLPADAPHARVTLTRSAILSSRAMLISCRGQKTRDLLEAALEDGAGSRHPIGRILADADQAIDIHWAP